ncbi:cysteine-rich receptor-like protein kinase 41 isoform X5 [Miscanthus floridulus]|uniref:cysteine-rich receptor-like protein kinase 41 isoform X5 n=1 Tax=Miscanthus floridulus TaxID=154761 RepID=UPI003458FEF3
MDNEPFRHCDLESILKDPSAQPYDLRLQYLRDITDDFSTERELGRGGFGVVYKGMLPNGKMIAVKILVSSSEVQQKQFKNEVDNLMRVRHQNIVQFVGYCYETWMKYTDYNGKHIFAERPKRLLCFEYMPKGSLDRYISDESSGLDWPSRYKIIKGICCGLHYLHEECQNNASVIHLDLKPANILLDDNMEPKIADFGLSKFFDDQKVQTCATTIAGSHGYMAPEYIWDHIITTKADIYSLGVIIIEMITGRRIGPFGITVTSCQDFVEPYQTLCSKQVLGKWRNRFEETPGHASPELECQQIESCLQIGLSCIKIDRMERPTAKEIIEKLHRWESTNCYASNEENSHKDKDSNRNALQQYAQGPSVEQMYHGSNFQQDTGGTTHSNYFEEGRVDGDSQLYQPDGDALPGIEGFQIAGEPRPGFQLTACGFPTNGTTLCNFQWVRHLENGIRQSIEGATMYDYVVTADDVGTLLAVDCTPMDDNGRQRHLWTRFANNGNKITCDPEMRSHIAAYISNGRAEFEVYVLQAYSPEEWEVATLVLTRPNYRIKLKKTGEVIIDEKYSQSLQTKIPNGRTTQFVLVTAGATLPFNTLGISEPNNEDHDVRLRDLIVLVMRTFQKKALDSKMEGKA